MYNIPGPGGTPGGTPGDAPGIADEIVAAAGPADVALAGTQGNAGDVRPRKNYEVTEDKTEGSARRGPHLV